MNGLYFEMIDCVASNIPLNSSFFAERNFQEVLICCASYCWVCPLRAAVPSLPALEVDVLNTQAGKTSV